METRFSSFEEKMLGLMADFLRQQRSANACLTTTPVTNNLCGTAQTSGACQPTGTRINTYGADKGRSNVISLNNSLNDEYLGSRSPVEREFQDNEDILSLQLGQIEARYLDLKTHFNVFEV